VGVTPAAPVLAAISNPDGDGAYLVDWNGVAGATSYRLEEDDNAGFTSPTVRYTGSSSQYQVSGQGTGRWYYRVRASGAGGDSPWSNTESVGVVPATPVLATISNPDGDGNYLLDWSGVTGATSYRLEEDDNSTFTSPSVRYNGANSQFQVTGQAGGTWYYRVRASNAGGDSPWSNDELVIVSASELEAPILSAISNPDGNGDYLVDWSDVAEAVDYTLEEDDDPYFSSPIVRYNGADSQYELTSHAAGTWYYRVRASNAGGDSAWSNSESVSVIPAAPELLPISNPGGIGEYVVDWDDVTGATSYQMEEDDNSAFTSPTVHNTGTSSQYQVTDQDGGTWYYRVRASNAGGDSPWSNPASVGVVPAAPTLDPIHDPDGNGTYLVDWSDVAGASSFRLEEDDNAGFTSPAVRYMGTNSQFQVYGQETGLWYYRVRASNAGGDGLWSNLASVGVIPAAPVLAAISNPDGNGRYLVDWGDVAGATSYRLEEDDNFAFASPTVVYTGAGSQFQMTGQGTGLWYYRVQASNAGGDSAWSNTELVGVIPATPVLAAISNPDGNGYYLVDWSDVIGATSFWLEEDDDAGFTTPTVRYIGASSQFQVSGQEAGLWYYRVRARNAGGNSAWSNAESAGVVPAASVLAAISNPEGDGEYLVDWDAVIGATSYRLEEDDNAGFTSPTVRYSGPNSQYQVSGQETGLWHYRVRASNAGGSGAWSNTESVGVAPADPSLAPISNPDGDGQYLLNWSDVAEAESYRLEEDDNADYSSPTVKYTGTDSQYEVTGQGTGRWYYRVRTSNVGGDSSWSNTESVGVVPEAPVLAAISNPGGDGEYLVDWSDVTGATSYEVEQADNPEFTAATAVDTVTSSQLQVYGQETGLWYYRVRSSNDGGDSTWSNTESVGVIPVTPLLAAISNPEADGEYLVDWSDVAGTTSYRLEEDDNAAFTSPTVRYSGSASEYQVSAQERGVWYYRVRASSEGGDSAWSNTKSVGVAPAAPVLAAISNLDGNRDYLVDWNDVADAASYRLEEDDNAAFSSPTVRYAGAGSQFQVYGQETGLWYYRVRASGAGGDSAWSNAQSVGVLPATPELDPITGPDEDGEYLVDWSDVVGATSYQLEEDDNPEFTSPTMRYSETNSQYQVMGQAGGTWYYRVRASNVGGDSPWSNTESVGVVPATPVLEPIENPEGSGEYLVDWDEVTGATSYRLEEDDNAGFASPTVVYAGANSQYETSAQGTSRWYYRVRASNAHGDSAWSNTQSVAVVPESPVLDPISNPDGHGAYLLDWGDVTGATSYRLEEADNPGFTSPIVRYNGINSQYQVTGQVGGTWYYRVRAGNAYGDSLWSNTESVAVLASAPALLPISNPDGQGEYVVDWNDVTGATGYQLEEDDSPDFDSPVTRYQGTATQFEVVGQRFGTWYYRVRADNDAGNGPWSAPQSAWVKADFGVYLPLVLRGATTGP
jgi:titin